MSGRVPGNQPFPAFAPFSCHFLPALLQKLVGEFFFGFFTGKFGKFSGKFGGNFRGFFSDPQNKGSKNSGKI